MKRVCVFILLLLCLGSGCATIRVSSRKTWKQANVAKLDSIFIPEIDFRTVTLDEAVVFLNQAIVDHRNSWAFWRPKGKELSIEVSVYPQQDDPFAPIQPADLPLITFTARELTVWEASKIVAGFCNLSCLITPSGLAFADRGTTYDPTPVRIYYLGSENISHLLDFAADNPPWPSDSAGVRDEEDKEELSEGERIAQFLRIAGLQPLRRASMEVINRGGENLMVVNTKENHLIITDILASFCPEWSVRQKLIEITIPVLKFRKKSIGDSLEYIIKESRRLDEWSSEDSRPGIDVSFATSSKSKDTRITIDAENVQLEAALDLIARYADMNWSITNRMVVFEEKSD